MQDAHHRRRPGLGVVAKLVEVDGVVGGRSTVTRGRRVDDGCVHDAVDGRTNDEDRGAADEPLAERVDAIALGDFFAHYSLREMVTRSCCRPTPLTSSAR